jgi:hypothetical protein
MNDSTFVKRPTPIKRPTPAKPPNIVAAVATDMTGGFRELQRQMGSAVATVKRNIEKIKNSLR